MIKHVFKLIWNKKGSNSLMILEIFLSFLVLFAVVGYVIFNLNIVNAPLGFDVKDRWIVNLDNAIELQDSLGTVTTLQNLKRELDAIEEIVGSTFLQDIVPFSNNNWRNGFRTEGDLYINTNLMPVDIAYGDLMNVQIKEGRWFNDDDLNANYRAMVINRKWLDHTEGEVPLDSIFRSDGQDYKVVGLVDNIKYLGEFDEERETMYFLQNFYENADNIVVKVKPGTDIEAEEKISNLINNVSKTTGSTIASLTKQKSDKSRHQWILMIGLLSICGFLCVNVALGLFGVLWYNINKRRSEIGLRQAIGAHSSQITMQFILEILILTGVAVGLGIFFAIQIPLLDVTEYPDSLFYKAILWATLIILALVLICALFPSLQAAKIKPAIALHED